MYQITYKKQNGEIFYRIRNTLPTTSIGNTTSMGWLVLDIKYCFNNNYYSFLEYKELMNKSKKRHNIIRKVNLFMKKYATTIMLLILTPLYLIELIVK